MQFQSTPPSRGATRGIPPYHHHLFISIHAPLAGGDLKKSFDLVIVEISIHAPLAGGDILRRDIRRQILMISIHAPLAGGDMLAKKW